MSGDTFYADLEDELPSERDTKDALPDHLDLEDGIVRCTACGQSGLRPLVHDNDCEHAGDREWTVEQQGLDGGRHDGQATLDGGVAKDGGEH